jgi:hypothetical protein
MTIGCFFAVPYKPEDELNNPYKESSDAFKFTKVHELKDAAVIVAPFGYQQPPCIASLNSHHQTLLIAQGQEEHKENTSKESIPMVTFKWLEASRSAKKSLPFEFFSTKESQIFSGCFVLVDMSSGIPEQDANILKAGIEYFGGKCGNVAEEFMESYLTHLVCLFPSKSEIVTKIQQEFPSVKTILPQFFILDFEPCLVIFL